MNSELRHTAPGSVLTYQTNDSASPQYLQVYVLSNLTTNTWTLAPALGRSRGRREAARHAGAGQGHADPHPVHETITLAQGLSGGQNVLSFLPLPYAARGR